MLGELTASIAHEVNQPLGAMVANAAACTRWLAADPPETTKARRALESIAADGRRASEIIGRIRALVKRQAPRKDLVDVNVKIAQVIELAADEIRRNDIVLRTELAEGLPRVDGDRVQLQQVLLNLILNAIDAMSPIQDRPRELTIASRPDDTDAVLVEVRDTGPGIDPEQAAQMFEPFYTTKSDGLGIGLSISRSIVEAHGGKLWVNANQPHGAIFRFASRRRRRHDASAASSGNRPNAQRGGSPVSTERSVVFVVDDDASMRGALENLLGSVGLEVRAFASPQEFLQAKRPDAPGCLVLDVRLPGKSGLAFQEDLDKGRHADSGHLHHRPRRHPDERAGHEGGGGRVPDQAVPRSGDARRDSRGARARPRSCAGSGGSSPS